MTENLSTACNQWQSGRNGGSSRLRAAARVLTGVPHYFDADFIRTQEDKARADQPSLERAGLLLDALAEAPLLSAQGWNAQVQLPERAFAGRGLEPKPPFDDDIEAALDKGRIDMALWGVSLDEQIAIKYGKGQSGDAPRFMITLTGEFPAVPAWIHSQTLPEEQELICGGSYDVVDVRREETTTYAQVRFRALPPRATR